MRPALEIRHLTRRFKDLVAVDDVSFQVMPGEIFGFIGPNGAGKTTTMRIAATLDLPDEGDVLIGGRSVLEEPRRVRRRMGFMPDAYGAYSHVTVDEYLDFFARAHGLRGAKRRQTLDFVSEFTGLDPLREKEMDALSKGMKQRLCLAKTLLHDPSLLILDEPAAGLDPRARVEFRELVKALAEMGKAVLISSHILAELSELCSGVAVIEAGRIRATGPVAEIQRRLRQGDGDAPHLARVTVRTLALQETCQRFLLEQPHVSRVSAEKAGLAFDFSGTQAELAGLLAEMVHRDLQPIEFACQETDLEDIFLTLTEGRLQ